MACATRLLQSIRVNQVLIPPNFRDLTELSRLEAECAYNPLICTRVKCLLKFWVTLCRCLLCLFLLTTRDILQSLYMTMHLEFQLKIQR